MEHLVNVLLRPIPTPIPSNSPLPTPTPTYLEHGPGVRHPWVIEKDGYLYLFYDRIDTFRFLYPMIYPEKYTGYPTPDPTVQANFKKSLITRKSDGAYLATQVLCVAKAPLNGTGGFLSYNPTPTQNWTSPWHNYFNDEWTQPANGGWSSPIYDEQRECPSVALNDYLNKYMMLCTGYVSNGPSTAYSRLFLHLNQDDTMTKWSTGLRLDLFNNDGTDDNPNYGFFVNKNDTSNGKEIGNVTKCGQNVYLYYLSGSTGVTSRISLQFIK